MASPPKRINAKQAARDIKSGMTAAELMKKYEISPRGLKLLKQRLITSGLLEKDDSSKLHSSASYSVKIAWKCPSCGSAQTRQYTECQSNPNTVRRMRKLVRYKCIYQGG